MKKYNVTISLIVGYYDDEDNTPKLKLQQFEVMANSETEAIKEAQKLDTSLLSVWETYANEIED